MSNSQHGINDYVQNDQNFTYNDGNTHVSYFSRQYSWSSSQQGTPALAPLAPVPVSAQQVHSQTMPQMLPMMNINQVHQQHLDLHRSHMQSAMEMQQNMISNMRQPLQFQQPQFAPPLQQQQQNHHSRSPPPRLPALSQRELLHIEAVANQSSRDIQAAERDKQLVGFAKDIKDHMQSNEQQARERANARAREQAVKEEQEEQRKEEQRALMYKLDNLNSQFAEFRRSQASMPQPASPVFDMAALQQAIREGRTEKISRDELKEIIESAVSEKVAGLAKSSEVESAASCVHRNIQKVLGASDAQVKESVQKELTNAINQIARNRPVQQQKIGPPDQQHAVSGPRMAQRVETQFTVEELPDDEEAKRTRKLSSHRKSTALPMPDISGDNKGIQKFQAQKPSTVVPMTSTEQKAVPALTADALSHLQPRAGISEATKVHHSKSRVSVMPTDSNALVQLKPSDQRSSSKPNTTSLLKQHSDSNALVKSESGKAQRSEREPSKTSNKSTVSVQPSENNALIYPRDNRRVEKPGSSKMSVQPSANNAMVRPGTGSMQRYASSAEAIAAAQATGGQLSKCDDGERLGELPDDFPDNASQVTAWQRRQDTKPTVAKGSTVSSIRPRNDRRMDKYSPSPMRQLETVQEQHGESTALVKQSKDVSKRPGR